MSPRIDLYRHLDGNIRIPTILELAEKNGIRLPARENAVRLAWGREPTLRNS